ncbi:hypothetical protein GpartN1_g1919.t1 [Galdieria partita]|uniref:RING-type domain-containing protein n=1 Tax=Galdieria partita TaxID=83374 RepID=A0A9C7PSW6_9RHOD|nr:hypothetical protein GpartN1_g1919.t1 [Galdieria partita]
MSQRITEVFLRSRAQAAAATNSDDATTTRRRRRRRRRDGSGDEQPQQPSSRRRTRPEDQRQGIDESINLYLQEFFGPNWAQIPFWYFVETSFSPEQSQMIKSYFLQVRSAVYSMEIFVSLIAHFDEYPLTSPVDALLIIQNAIQVSNAISLIQAYESPDSLGKQILLSLCLSHADMAHRIVLLLYIHHLSVVDTVGSIAEPLAQYRIMDSSPSVEQILASIVEFHNGMLAPRIGLQFVSFVTQNWSSIPPQTWETILRLSQQVAGNQQINYLEHLLAQAIDDQANIQRTPPPGFHRLSAPSSPCPICRDDEHPKEYAPNPCSHGVCYECAETLARSQNRTCPFCRSAF